MKYQPPKFTDKELLEMFPEAKNIISKKIKECKEAIKEKEQEMGDALNKIYALETDKFSEWFGEEVVRMQMMPALEELELNLLRLNHLKYLSNPNLQKNDYYKFEEKIENAKRYPIAELARSKLEFRQVGKNFVILCPFHNEKTPSFYIYPETNRFYCFGCQEKGDVITLTMALYGINFKEAVALLQN